MDQHAESSAHDNQEADTKKWRQLNAEQRRILGVLVEKAKTTPESYPLSLNAIATASNQKSNRSPQMNLDAEDVEVELDNLREFGAVVEVQAGGRVAKYKHLAYEWLGVDKYELAVMAELLLRGEQTVGELRGRAARMEPIADLNTLKPILRSLVEKGLVIELTPAGRGQVVTHALYSDRRIDELRQQYAGNAASPPARSGAATIGEAPTPSTPAIDKDDFRALQSEVAELRDLVERLRSDLDKLLS